MGGVRLHQIGDYKLAWVEGLVGPPAEGSQVRAWARANAVERRILFVCSRQCKRTDKYGAGGATVRRRLPAPVHVWRTVTQQLCCADVPG